MTPTRRYKRGAFEAIHGSAMALRKVGAISKDTMRSFDESCLTAPKPLAPRQIKTPRGRWHGLQILL